MNQEIFYICVRNILKTKKNKQTRNKKKLDILKFNDQLCKILKLITQREKVKLTILDNVKVEKS